MAFQDLRAWLEHLKAEEELATVTERVTWDKEIGGIVQRIFDTGGPAVLFENIEDHQDTLCRRLFSASLGSFRRTALALGLPKDTPYRDQIQVYRDRIKEPVKPKTLARSPVERTVVKGDDIDLFQFPAPLWHDRDGGRYIGTFDGVVTRDPDTGQLNIGLYRRMIHDARNMGITVIPGQHIWRHFRKYRQLGRPVPVAMVNGWDPVLPFVAASPQPLEVCEYDIMGALRRAPVELIQCETVDLAVPATAEIIVEGEITTNFEEFRMEGPFGEYTGYYTSEANKKPVFKANLISVRQDPILQGTLEGVPINEDHHIAAINHSALLFEKLKENVNGIKAVNVDPSTAWANVIIQIDNSYLGQVHQAAAGVWSLSLSTMVGKNIIVVDEDIDPFDLNKVMWALAYRVDPPRDLIQFPGWVSPTDPVVHPDARTRPAIYKGTRLLIDATKPVDNKRSDKWFGEKFAPVCYPDDATMELVARKWSDYGIAGPLGGKSK